MMLDSHGRMMAELLDAHTAAVLATRLGVTERRARYGLRTLEDLGLVMRDDAHHPHGWALTRRGQRLAMLAALIRDDSPTGPASR